MARNWLHLKVAGRRLRIAAPPGVHPVDDFLGEVLERLPPCRGASVLDLGCGTGVYGLAARLKGASEVWLTDVDPRAVRCARANARRNRLSGVEARVGDLFRPVEGRRFDLIIASLPQTPGPVPFLLSKWGGADGARHLRRFLAQAPRHLKPGGRVFFLLHELADREAVEAAARRRFSLRAVFKVRREFEPSEYDGYFPGLFAYLERQRRRGRCRFHRRGASYWFLLRCFVGELKPRAAEPIS